MAASNMPSMTKAKSSTSVRDLVTPEEWEQRVALAAAYRLVAHYRWDDLIFTHLSARVPGREHHFLINPYGMTFDEITASSLIKVDLAGRKVMDLSLPDQSGRLHHSQRHPRRARRRQVHPPCAQPQRRCRLGAERRPAADLTAIHLRARLAGVSRLRRRGATRRREAAARARPWRQEFLHAPQSRTDHRRRQRAGRLFASLHVRIGVYDSGPRASRRRRARPHRSKNSRNRTQQAQTVLREMGGALAWPALLRKIDRIDPSYRD